MSCSPLAAGKKEIDFPCQSKYEVFLLIAEYTGQARSQHRHMHVMQLVHDIQNQ